MNKSKPKKTEKRYDTQRLTGNPKTIGKYERRLIEEIEKSIAETRPELSMICNKVAAEVVGFKAITKKGQKDNTEIIELSKEQKEIRLKIENTKDKDTLEMLKSKYRNTENLKKKVKGK